jgi:hypothetical protein
MILHHQTADTGNNFTGSVTVNNSNHHASREGSEGKSTDTAYETPEIEVIEHHWDGTDHRVLGDGVTRGGGGNIDDMI